MAKPQYGHDHQQERDQADRRLRTMGPIRCRRCGRLVYCDRDHHLNRDGRKFQLGHGVAHAEGGAGTDKQPEHAWCNESAGGKLAQAMARAKRQAEQRKPARASRRWA